MSLFLNLWISSWILDLPESFFFWLMVSPESEIKN
jgi:hypothetical protein